jgi:cell division protein FtsL
VTSGVPAGQAGGRPALLPKPRYTSRAAVLAVVLCAVGLSLAYPVREYIAERRQIDQLAAQNAQTAAAVRRLQAEQRALGSNSYIERLARDKLHMCFPKQRCYVVIYPSGHAPEAAHDAAAKPWYAVLWQSVQEADKGPASPR